jgi:hypothetical protein
MKLMQLNYVQNIPKELTIEIVLCATVEERKADSSKLLSKTK